MATQANYMATDQFGNTFHNLGCHPRKALLEQLGYKAAKRIYCDSNDGNTYHTGYVVGPHWCQLYRVEPLRKSV